MKLTWRDWAVFIGYAVVIVSGLLMVVTSIFLH